MGCLRALRKSGDDIAHTKVIGADKRGHYPGVAVATDAR